MAVSAHDVAVEFRRRLPGLPVKKLHKLLYYAQGHHLAAFGAPLFSETISAWDMGPVVGAVWHRERQGLGEDNPARHVTLDEGQLNTIGYVVSRYGALSGRDLEHLTHSETPWQRADRDRRPKESARIEQAWIGEYFATEDADDTDDPALDTEDVRRWLARTASPEDLPDIPDDLNALRARLSERA